GPVQRIIYSHPEKVIKENIARHCDRSVTDVYPVERVVLEYVAGDGHLCAEARNLDPVEAPGSASPSGSVRRKRISGDRPCGLLFVVSTISAVQSDGVPLQHGAGRCRRQQTAIEIEIYIAVGNISACVVKQHDAAPARCG